MRAYCAERGAKCVTSQAFARGAEGAVDLAEAVVAAIDANPNPPVRGVYEPGDSAQEKITKVATQVYGAAGVTFSETALAKLARFADWGFAHLPVCIAKTQYSLSDDPALLGAPTGWTLRITDVSLSAGAGFLVAISGAMMLMPGLPKESRALSIDVDGDGEIIGI
jgi:formate--tetrahydrofolate ligase